VHRILAADLGQANDYTALIALQSGTSGAWEVNHIQRVALNTRYPDIVRHSATLLDILSQPVPSRGESETLVEMSTGIRREVAVPRWTVPKVSLVLDYTGVGRPVLDMFLEAQADGLIPPDVDVIAVTITGGYRVTWDEHGTHVPKRELASTVQRVMQEERLKISRSLPMAPLLTEELLGFRVKVTAAGSFQFGAGEDWRSAQHDDLVLALALGLWFGEATAEG
jgi:hypothetical protein